MRQFVRKSIDRFDRAEMRVAAWMEKHGFTLLRIAMGVVFIWFGALKPLGLSPAEELVAKTTSWLPIPHFLVILGVWEVAIGVCFLSQRLIRWALILLFVHMPGTMLPLVMLPEVTFVEFPFVLTLEGQYIIKNLVLVAAAIVLGGKLRHRMRGLVVAAPDGFHTLLRKGRWAIAKPGDVLTKQGAPVAELLFIRSGSGVVRIDEEQVGALRPNQFVGEMSFLSGDMASATVEVTETVKYIAWSKDDLKQLFAGDGQDLEHAMQATMNLDLVDKLRQANRHGRLRTPKPTRKG